MSSSKLKPLFLCHPLKYFTVCGCVTFFKLNFVQRLNPCEKKKEIQQMRLIALGSRASSEA